MFEYFASIPKPLQYGGGAVALALILGSIAARILPKTNPNKWSDLLPRMRSWWWICALAGGSLMAGWQATVIFFTFVSFLALKEFVTLAPTRREDRPVILLIYAANLISYWTIWADHYPYFLVIAPIYVFVAAAAMMALIGRTDGFLATAGILHWGVVICVFNIGHVAFLMRTPAAEVPQAGPAGLVFFLLLMTQLNDVAQYIWGKMFGRHKIVPRVSPNKTWEGAIGGWLTTAILFVWLAPFFTPLTLWPSVFVGATLPILGFLGDITMSAVKRDLGVKDTSRLIPGHGGVLDRVDSLTFTAPWYFHMLALFALERF